MSLIEAIKLTLKSATGVASLFYAKAKVDEKMLFPSIPQIKGSASPAFEGDVEAFITANGDTAEVKRLLKNKVKKCVQCGKPNAFTLSSCNQCGRTLSDVLISYSNNIFTSFIFGIQKGPFPFTISLRYQADDVLVFDDLLALSPCHLNVIPTANYIPDWRYLLRRPAEGLKIMQRMHSACVDVLVSQFLKNSEWRAAYLNSDVSDEEVIANMATGFNYPPSQYQLHTQFILPAMLPFQFYQYRNGIHFTPRRFFPSKYVQETLTALANGGKNLPDEFLKEETPIDVIIDAVKEILGIDYDEIHGNFYKSFENVATKFSNWKPDSFQGVIIDNSAYFSWDGKNSCSSPAEIANIVKEDKEHIQSYGKPLCESKKLTGSFYSTPKKPGDLVAW